MIHNSDWRTRIVNYPSLIEWLSARPDVKFCDMWEGIVTPKDVSTMAWLPHIAVAGGATIQQLALATCGVAKQLCAPVEDSYALHLRAIEIVESWANGKASLDQVLDIVFDLIVYSNGSARELFGATYLITGVSSIASEVHAAIINTALVPYSTHPNFSVDMDVFNNTPANYASLALMHGEQAGFDGNGLLAKFRELLPFEPVREKRLTHWQRLAMDD